MTDDRMNTIKGRLNDYADELEDNDSILMMQSIYVRDVAYLIAEIERLKVKNQPPDLTAGEFNRGE